MEKLKTRKIKVYVAGPYTKGDVALNVKNAIITGDKLSELGYIPFIPHFSHFWHMLLPHGYQFWMDYDKQWLLSCDCLLRIPGESSGADQEIKDAVQNGIKVFYSITGMEHYYNDIAGNTLSN